MHEWSVILTQPDHGRDGVRTTVAVVCALDAQDATRRAQRTLPGWTAVIVERLFPGVVPFAGVRGR